VRVVRVIKPAHNSDARYGLNSEFLNTYVHKSLAPGRSDYLTLYCAADFRWVLVALNHPSGIQIFEIALSVFGKIVHPGFSTTAEGN